jgi:hypothetical protein
MNDYNAGYRKCVLCRCIGREQAGQWDNMTKTIRERGFTRYKLFTVLLLHMYMS